MSGFLEKVGRFSWLLRRWVSMFLMMIYWHAPQGIGRLFIPGRLKGYYNDLTAKVYGNGPVDEEGLPLNESGGKRAIFSTTLFQKALGHWDLWLASNQKNEAHRLEFSTIARWALRNQDEEGGWPIWPLLGLSYASPYSTMPQGEAISVLDQAYSLTSDSIYLDAASRSVNLMGKSIEDGRTCRVVSDGLILEEVPAEKYKAILNGWVFTLFNLHETTYS